MYISIGLNAVCIQTAMIIAPHYPFNIWDGETKGNAILDGGGGGGNPPSHMKNLNDTVLYEPIFGVCNKTA